MRAADAARDLRQLRDPRSLRGQVVRPGLARYRYAPAYNAAALDRLRALVGI
jgi:hypothetical protein